MECRCACRQPKAQHSCATKDPRAPGRIACLKVPDSKSAAKGLQRAVRSRSGPTFHRMHGAHRRRPQGADEPTSGTGQHETKGGNNDAWGLWPTGYAPGVKPSGQRGCQEGPCSSQTPKPWSRFVFPPVVANFLFPPPENSFVVERDVAAQGDRGSRAASRVEIWQEEREGGTTRWRITPQADLLHVDYQRGLYSELGPPLALSCSPFSCLPAAVGR